MKARKNWITAAGFAALVFLSGCSAGAVPAVETVIAPLPLASTVTSPAPTAEPTPAPPAVRSIAAGWGFTLALTDAGNVKCWGAGSVCDGSTVNKSTPVDVAGLAGIAAIAAGGGHACALTDAGGVKCWGLNNFGQLGNYTREASTDPVDVAGLSGGVAAISAGGGHTCALTQTGGVKCWGQNDFGQLGDGTQNLSRVPVDVLGLNGGVRAIASGGTHTCAVLESGGVRCWGFNGSGQLGNPDTDVAGRYQPVPADVQGLSEAAVEAAAGFAVTCVRTERGGVKCWGQRGNGQLGDGLAPEGQKQSSFLPVDVFGLAEGAVSIAVGGGTACAVTGAGALFCWGTQTGAEDPAARDLSFAPVPVSGFSGGVATVSAGDMHVCVLTDSGIVKCWGNNLHGQLGDGTTENRHLPVEVVGLTQV